MRPLEKGGLVADTFERAHSTRVLKPTCQKFTGHLIVCRACKPSSMAVPQNSDFSASHEHDSACPALAPPPQRSDSGTSRSLLRRTILAARGGTQAAGQCLTTSSPETHKPGMHQSAHKGVRLKDTMTNNKYAVPFLLIPYSLSSLTECFC